MQVFRDNTKNLPQPVQMPLSGKSNAFSQCFLAFLEFTWDIEHFGKKIEPHNLSISEIIHSKKFDY